MLLTKYGLTEVEDMQKNITRLTNQLWKLIPMREHEEDWQKQLDTVIIEIAGMNEIMIFTPSLFSLLSKLEGLKVVDVPFMLYRKTVFEVFPSVLGSLRWQWSPKRPNSCSILSQQAGSSQQVQ